MRMAVKIKIKEMDKERLRLCGKEPHDHSSKVRYGTRNVMIVVSVVSGIV